MVGCKGRATTRTNLRINFLHCHVRYTIVILEEGNCPHPHCPACDMSIPWSALNRRHPSLDLYARENDRKRRILAEEEVRVGATMALWDYDWPLEIVPPFKYLGPPASD